MSTPPPGNPAFPEFVLEQQPYIDLTVRLYRTWRKLPNGGEDGIMFFTVMPLVVGDGKGGEIGTMGGAVGTPLFLVDRRRSGWGYAAVAEEVWAAFQTALEAVPGEDIDLVAPLRRTEC